MRQGLVLICIALVVSGCGASASHTAATPSDTARPSLPVNTNHRVVVARSWTLADIPKIARRVYPGGAAAATGPRVVRVAGKKGLWLVWSDPTHGPRIALCEWWTTGVVADLYHDRRRPSAPDLVGAYLTTRPKDYLPDFDGFVKPVRVFHQGRVTELRAHANAVAPLVGLAVRSFRAPRLGGILEPIVTFSVTNPTLFNRWFDPNCLGFRVLGRVPGSDYTPAYGAFLTVTDSAGRWLYSHASVGGMSSTKVAPRAAARWHALLRGMNGMFTCSMPS